MFINKLQLKNFKRFTDLTIDLISAQNESPPKLVLLIGANGCGKSCIFDAFESVNGIISNEKLIRAFEDLQAEKTKGYLSGLGLPDHDYCLKEKDIKNEYEIIIDFDKEKIFNIHYKGSSETNIVGQSSIETNLNVGNYFYGRTAFRNIIDLETKFNADEYGEKDVQKVIEKNLDKPSRLIDLDKRWDGDILYCFKEEINRKELTIEINQSLNSIFENNPTGHFQIESIRSEIGRSIKLTLEVLIRKGNSVFPYEYLSAGEKQLFTILLNLHLRKKYIENTIIYLDEIDLHLNTAIQADLLKEITEKLIPDNSQVWVASHSLGFIDYARQITYKYDEITETEVEIKKVIIDFDSLDFDQEQVLKPANKDDLNIFTVPIPISSIENIVQLPSIILCEGKDSKYYSGQNSKQFFGVKDKFNVLEWCWRFKCLGIIDKDYLFKTESIKLENKFKGKLKVLKYYSIENYLLHPDNLKEYDSSLDLNVYQKEITEAKNEYLQNKISDYFSQIRSNYKILKSRKDEGLKHDWLVEMEDSSEVLNLFKSDNFEIFYEFFPIKDENKKIKSIQEILKNTNKSKESLYLELSQTNWFKTKISEVLQ